VEALREPLIENVSRLTADAARSPDIFENRQGFISPKQLCNREWLLLGVALCMAARLDVHRAFAQRDRHAQSPPRGNQRGSFRQVAFSHHQSGSIKRGAVGHHLARQAPQRIALALQLIPVQLAVDDRHVNPYVAVLKTQLVEE
jgi:hypothetical protein